MKVAAVKEFHDNVNRMLNSKDTILVTSHGKTKGIYLPITRTIPLPIRKLLYMFLSEKVNSELKELGFSEKEIEHDFRQWRDENHAPLRG